MRKFLAALVSIAFLGTLSTATTFEVKGRDYLLDGKPLLILSGEMHYPRVPRDYWHDRLKKAKAMGLNTICTYLFWNVHEPQPGQWDFSGNADFVAFIKACQEEGLHVIYADSEELTGDDGTAANVIDNQPTTFWHSEWKSNSPAHPHQIVLDLGGVRTITGFRYLPRAGENNEGGRIKNYRVFLSDKPFPGR